MVLNKGEVQNIPCKSNSTIVNLKELIRTNSTVNIDSVHFTHIMKCGGSTIDDMLWRSKFAYSFELVSKEAANTLPSALFGSIASKYDNIIDNGTNRARNINRKNKQIQLKNKVNQNSTYCNRKLQNKLVLVIVRDPIDRVISHYNQVRPWGNHTGFDRACARAASKGFRSFLNACKFSKDFMSSYHNRRIIEVLPYYSLVIPFEHFNSGLVLLHMYFGFKVEDILYVVKKNYTQMPKVHISEDDVKLAFEQNKKDFQLHRAAQEHWNHTIDSLVVDKKELFQRNVVAFKKLLDDFQYAFVLNMRNYTSETVTIPPKRKGGKISKVICTTGNFFIKECRIKSEMDIVNTFCKTNAKCYSNNLSL
jgi:hypothetical protein